MTQEKEAGLQAHPKTHCIVVGGISTNCWIYRLGEESQGSSRPAACAVIDPGADGERIAALLDRLGLFPAYILLTHGHFDHIAALPFLADEYGGRAGFAPPEIAVHSGDARFLGPGSYAAHCETFKVAGGSCAYVDSLWQEMPLPGRILSDGDTVGPFSVLHLPGHTPGSIAFLDRENGVLFSGDTLFRGGYGRTDLPGGDAPALAASLKRLSSLEPGIRVCPGHGGETSVAVEFPNFA
jgi:glyoxylase-like metal-dependent hydrolase (beta-lactamase superfamily II)